jgi:3-ketosteroid 9alpha-monooxygenase subunit A
MSIISSARVPLDDVRQRWDRLQDGLGVAMKRFPHDPFGYGWYQLCHADELAKGEVRPFRAFGRDFVLWRSEAGTPHLLDAHCPHLGAHLGHGGRVDGANLRCPFHGWTFDGSGACIAIPYSEGAALERRRTTSWPVAQQGGILFAWWHPAGKAPSFALEALAEAGRGQWSRYRRHRWSVRSIWQEVQENLADSAHFRYLHGVRSLPTVDRFDADGPFLAIKMSQEFMTPRGAQPGFIATRLTGPYVASVHFKIGQLAEIQFVTAVVPIEEEEVALELSFTAHLGAIESPDMSLALVDEVIRQVDQDVTIWTNKAHWPKPNLAPGDGPIMDFRRWTEQFSRTRG